VRERVKTLFPVFATEEKRDFPDFFSCYSMCLWHISAAIGMANINQLLPWLQQAGSKVPE
jgi:hypothetical protein